MLYTRIACMPIAIAAMNTTAQPYVIESSTVDAGGGTSSAGAFEVTGTIGQPDAGEPMTGGGFIITGGFWAGIDTTGNRLCADQNGDGLVTPADYNAWILNYNNRDPRADTNQDGLVTPADYNGWILAFNQGMNGPICTP